MPLDQAEGIAAVQASSLVVPAPYLRLQGINKAFGDGDNSTLAISGVDLDVREGEFLGVIGPSGCGKSTLLQIAAGLTTPTRGQVSFEGREVVAPPAGIVYLFQQYSKSLFPWRTVIDNVAFAIEHLPGMTKERARQESRRYLEMVGVADFSHKFPFQLSGGMQQRVTIARALAAQPRVLLMDEPFSSVDALTRLDLNALILELWQQQRFTGVLVTHDVEEAVFLADRVAVLSRRPAHLVEVVQTQLPRPRDNIATRELPRFIELRHHLLEQLLHREP